MKPQPKTDKDDAKDGIRIVNKPAHAPGPGPRPSDPDDRDDRACGIPDL